MRKAKKRIIIFSTLLILILICCDMRLKTVVYTIESEKVTQSVRVALITDLHSCRYGKEQKVLIDAVNEQKPDIVLLGGDVFDDKRSYENTRKTLEQLVGKYPCYFVTGNHEYWGKDIENILNIVNIYGIENLSGECAAVEINGQTINLCGVDDPDVVVYTENGIAIEEQLELAEEAADTENFTLLLSHRPELVDAYLKHDFDLILSGHAHGGQWRIPGILNGLYAPNQKWFPKYAGGRYDFENTTMIVSRGLARESTKVPRIFNRPELVIIDIK